MPKNFSLSVMFPVYNDGESMRELIPHILEMLPAVSSDFEIILVDDGSAQATRDTLKHLASLHPALIRIITHPTNQGYGAALRSGFKAARKEYCFYTDGDGQYDINQLKELVQALDSNTDLVNGYKINRCDPLYRIIIGNIYNATMRLFFRIPLKDVDCDFRLIRTSFLHSLTLRSSSGTICVEFLRNVVQKKALYKEIPVRHLPRKFGKSVFFNFRHLCSTAYELMCLWWQLMVKRKYSA